ncbi:MAG: undecaprenyl-diphosphatase [Rhodobacteraceae bacterium]|nr:MAG: undecaprenyl-diphosphatase [Paracoccaceae bacterium]
MQNLNQFLFYWINAPADPSGAAVLLARVFAEWLIYAIAIAMVWGWIRGSAGTRLCLIDAGVGATAALAINFAIAAIWYHPRPFELGIGTQILPHAVDASFPSDHATVLFAVAFSLMISGARQPWPGLALLAAVGAAWSRVYLGVHWPLDMVGSFVVALVSVWGVRRVAATASARHLRQGVLKIYDRTLDALKIPGHVSPRAFRS